MCSELPSTEDSAADSFRMTWTLGLQMYSEPWSNTRANRTGQRVRGHFPVNVVLCMYYNYCTRTFS